MCSTGLCRCKHIEPHRTFSNYIFTVKEVYIPCYLCEDVVREGSMCICIYYRYSRTTPNSCFEKVPTSPPHLGHTESSNYTLTEIARYLDFFHMSSGWFDCTEPSPTTSLQGIRCKMKRYSITGAYSFYPMLE